MKNRLTLCVFYVLSICSSAFALDCTTVIDDSNKLIGSFKNTEYLSLLTDCINSCNIDTASLCAKYKTSMLTAAVQATDIAFAQGNYYYEAILQTPQPKTIDDISEEELKLYNNAVLKYTTFINYAAISPGDYTNKIAVARNNMEKIHNILQPLQKTYYNEGLKAIDNYDFDTVRDDIYAMREIEYGSYLAEELRKKAVEKLEIYLASEMQNDLDTINQMTSTVSNMASNKPERTNNNTVKKKYSNKINQMIKKHNSRLSLFNDNNSSDAIIGNEAVAMKAYESAQKLVKIAKDNNIPVTEIPVKPVLRAENPLNVAIDKINKGEFNQAITILTDITKNKSFKNQSIASAYMYKGIAFSLQITSGNSKSATNNNYKSEAQKAFVNAKAFNPSITLPKNYASVQTIFNSAIA